MSLEGFVHAVAGLMGTARDAFGAGGFGGSATLHSTERPPAIPNSSSGQAADAASKDTRAVDEHVHGVRALDCTARTAIDDAVQAADAGRARVETAISQASAEIAALAPLTNTPAGRQCLIDALTRRLHDAKRALEDGDHDAATRAAAADAGAGDYQGLGRFGGGASIAPPIPQAPMAQPQSMPAMAQMPQMPIPPMPMLPLGGLARLPTMLAGTSRPGPSADINQAPSRSDVGSSAAAIPLSEVRYQRTGFDRGRDAYRGYIAKALDAVGIGDQRARNNWMRGLLVAAGRESAFNPDAVNLTDSNARGARMPDGAPAQASRGGLQTIPTTFAAHHQPGTSTNIYDPVANVAAAMNYVMRRYHVSRDGSDLAAKVPQFNPHHGPQGY